MKTQSESSRSMLARGNRVLGLFPESITLLVLRITLALPFFRSGLTKWSEGPQLADSAVYLFTEEFRLHVFGHSFAYPFPTAVAFLSACAEIVLPILLVLGLGTRFAALGLLAMTGVIQLTVPDGWETYHLPWAAMALAIMTFGPGRLAVDRWIPALRGAAR